MNGWGLTRWCGRRHNSAFRFAGRLFPATILVMSELPPLRDYSRSRAVLVGTWQYSNLHPIPAAEQSLRRMYDVLTGPWCGWPTDRVTQISNETRQGDLPLRLMDLFADTDRDGVALFYFVGH